MVILDNLEEENENIKRELRKYKMDRAIKIVKIEEGSLTKHGLDKDMRDLMILAINNKPSVFKGYDLRLHAVRNKDTNKLILYIGTYNPL